MMQFDLIDMQLFVNIAEANSITQGAEHSHISVPAASMRIKNLEGRIGAKLLYRTNHGVTLTPAGQAFLHHGQLVQQQLQHLRANLQEYARGVAGHVRISANTNATAEFLPSVLRAYLETHPDINIDLRERVSTEIVRAVTDGISEIGIIAGNVRTEGLEVLPYRRDRLVLVTAVEHVLARHKQISFYRTLEFNYVGLTDATAIQSFLNQHANRLHRPIKIRIQVGNFEALCRMVETNIGIGVLPETAARRHRKTMAIRVVELSDPWAVRNLQICVRNQELLPVFAKELLQLLIADGLTTKN